MDSPSGNIGALTTSMASMKLSLESISNQRNPKSSTVTISDDNILQVTDSSFRSGQNNSILSHYKNFRSISTIGSISELPEPADNLTAVSSSTKLNTSNQFKTLSDEKTDVTINSSKSNNSNKIRSTNLFERKKSSEKSLQQQKAFDFDIVVGGELVDEPGQQQNTSEKINCLQLELQRLRHRQMQKEDERFEAVTVEKEDSAGYSSLNTPETPSANLSLTTTTTTNDATKFSQNSLSFTSSSIPPSILISPISNLNRSWDDDILEFDIKFHELHDTSFRNDVKENLFYKDDPFSILPSKTNKNKNIAPALNTTAAASTSSNASNVFDL